MFKIPVLQNRAFFRQRVTLDGADYVLDFEWNMRSGWYMGLSAVARDGEVVELFAPRRMLSNRNLISGTTSDLRPRGALVALDLTGQGAPASKTDFGTQVELIYLTEEEVEARNE